MASSNPIDIVQGKFKEIEAKLNAFKASQAAPVMIAVEGLQGAVSGIWIGAASFYFNKQLSGAQTMNPNMTPEMKASMDKMRALQPQTVLASMRNFVVLFGVQSALTAAFKHYRKGKDDVWNTVGPALGAGAAFAVASGTPDQAAAMAMGFAVFSGLFYKVGEMTGNNNTDGKQSVEDRFRTSHHVLSLLKLDKYHKNLRNGQLTDDTIMLWNDSALRECKIPPGPRLLILHHIEQVRNKKNPEKMMPAYPMAVPQGYTVGEQ